MGKTNKQDVLFRWLPALLWAAFIFMTSANSDPYRPLPGEWTKPAVSIVSASGPQRVSYDELLGRFSHAGEFVVLAFLTARALAWRGKLSPLLLAIAFGICALYALSDEVHQLFVPGRAFEWSDLTLDVGGSAIGLITYGSILRFWKK